MSVSTKAAPSGYHTITPYLMVAGVPRLIEFLEQALAATVRNRTVRADGAIGHAELQIGDSRVMLSEATDQWPAMPASLYVYVDDADESYRRALAAGGRSIMEPADMEYGDRHGGVADPSGNQWWLATPIGARGSG